MSGLRLAMVSRRYWPLTGDAETELADLAEALLDLGHRPQIVTAQWQKSWPAELLHRGIPVHRLSPPSPRWWGAHRTVRNLERWLAARQAEFDLVVSVGLGPDGGAVLGGLRGSGTPVVFWARTSGPAGDVVRLTTSGLGGALRRRYQAADAVIASWPGVASELAAAGFSRERICEIPCGAPGGGPRNKAQQDAARTALAEADARLHLPPGALLAVVAGALEAGRGLVELVRAWSIVLAVLPQVRLWIVGEGPLESELRKAIEQQLVSHRVILTGAFDDLEDVLGAADVLVEPGGVAAMPYFLVRAMAAGLPIAAEDGPQLREAAAGRPLVRWAEKRGSQGLAAAALDVLQHPQAAQQTAAAARSFAAAHYSLAAAAQAHARLYDELVQRSRP